MTDTTTLEGAIAWMDRALQETRYHLEMVRPNMLGEVSKTAAEYLGVRAACLSNGPVFKNALEADMTIDLVWHGVSVRGDPISLDLFIHWLAAARVKAGAE
jgi:hypothetical protein